MQGPRQLPESGHLRATWLPACASKQLCARAHLPPVGIMSDIARLHGQTHCSCGAQSVFHFKVALFPCAAV